MRIDTTLWIRISLDTGYWDVSAWGRFLQGRVSHQWRSASPTALLVG
jgi:hypothetical protein